MDSDGKEYVKPVIKPQNQTSISVNNTSSLGLEDDVCGKHGKINIQFQICICNDGWYKHAKSGVCNET